jgi:hypothetical protein
MQRICVALSCHGRLVTGFSPRRLGFAPGVVRVWFVVDKLALGQNYLRTLRLSPVSIIPPLLNSHSCVMWVMDSGPVRGFSSTETGLTPSQKQNAADSSHKTRHAHVHRILCSFIYQLCYSFFVLKCFISCMCLYRQMGQLWWMTSVLCLPIWNTNFV